MAEDARGARGGALRGGEPIVGVVLAAGEGARMGGNKALLLVPATDGAGDEPLAHLHARRMREAGAEAVVLVTRPEIAASFEGPCEAAVAVQVAVSRAPDQAGSLAVGLRARRDAHGMRSDAILVLTPVDALPASLATLGALISAVRAGAEAATPQVATGPSAGRGGHPVVVRARVFEDVLASSSAMDDEASRPLNVRLHALGARRVRVDVDDPAIRTDLDTPADLAAAAATLESERGQPLGQPASPATPRFWTPR